MRPQSSRRKHNSNTCVFSCKTLFTIFFFSVGKVDADGSRFLVGDFMGNLHMLVLTHKEGKLQSLSFEKLGKTSVSSTLSYLDNGFVFVGSRFSDSQLVKIKEEKEDDSFVEVFQEYTNLGPIVDFAVVDLQRQGQCQVVTCSGGLKEGFLRVITNGIGIEEQATIGLEGMKGLWSMKPSIQSEYDKYLVVSFVSETRFFSMEDEELEELVDKKIEAFKSDVQTIYCGNIVGDQFIQA